MRNNLQTVYNKMEMLGNKNVSQTSMTNMLKELTRYLFKGYADIGEQMIVCEYAGEMFNGRMEMEFDDSSECLTVRLEFPVKCCPENRARVSALLHLINARTRLGVFDCDPRDGSCEFKYVHYYGDCAMTQRQACQAAGIVLSSVRRCEHTVFPLLNGREPDKEKACEEYALLPEGEATMRQTAAEAGRAAEQENRVGETSRSDAQQGRAEERSRPPERETPSQGRRENASAPAPERSEALRFELDNDEMLRLFNDSCAQSASRAQRPVEPTQGSEADEEREKGGIPVQPEPASDIHLEPGEMAIALNDSGEMVGLVTGAGAQEEAPDDGAQSTAEQDEEETDEEE